MSYVNFRGQRREIVSQPLWDTYDVLQGNTTTGFTWFQIPRGGAAGKTLEDTNMVLAGQLPRPQVFHAKAFSFFIKENTPTDGIPLADYGELLDGTLQLIVGSKVMLELPLYWMVSGFGHVLYGGATGIIQGNGFAGHGHKWFLKHRVLIDENENFRGEVTYETAPTPTSTLDKVNCMLFMDGELIRSIQ